VNQRGVDSDNLWDVFEGRLNLGMVRCMNGSVPDALVQFINGALVESAVRCESGATRATLRCGDAGRCNAYFWRRDGERAMCGGEPLAERVRELPLEVGKPVAAIVHLECCPSSIAEIFAKACAIIECAPVKLSTRRRVLAARVMLRMPFPRYVRIPDCID
jgi:hypothetical protein